LGISRAEEDEDGTLNDILMDTTLLPKEDEEKSEDFELP